MKNLCTLFLATLFLAAMAASATAMQHDHSGHGQPAASGHTGHQEMLMLGTVVQDGVRAVAHLNDVRAAMAKAGMKETHHFMIFFEEEGSGKKITTGTAAVKITGPDRKESGPVALMGMDGHFGADIVLGGKGRYQFTVGSRLADGKTRQFEFVLNP